MALCIWSGICFTVPYFLTAWLIGPEFPSLIGSLLGLLILIHTTRRDWFVPKERWDFPNKKSWPKEWKAAKSIEHKKKGLTKFKAILPYILIGLLLALTRIQQLPFGKMLQKVKYNLAVVMGAEINYSVAVLYSPGIIFIIVAIFTIFLLKVKISEVEKVVKHSLNRIKMPFLALIFAVSLVQIIILSKNNLAAIPGMPLILAEGLAKITGPIYPLFSPLIGMVGSFISGSNTVSNLFFASFQYETALALSISPIIIVALQAVGGAIGNMIAIHNVIAACATVGLKNQEGRIIKINLIPALIYSLLAGIIGLILIYIL